MVPVSAGEERGTWSGGAGLGLWFGYTAGMMVAMPAREAADPVPPDVVRALVVWACLSVVLVALWLQRAWLGGAR